MPQSQLSALIGRLPLFNTLSEETLRNLAIGTRQIHITRNERVYAKGEQADFLHVVVGGQIKLYLTLANDGEKLVGMVGNGMAFDISAVILGEPHPANAVARQDSHLLLMDRYTLLKELRRDGELSWRLLNEAARIKIGLLRDIESCTHRSSLQRVACFLLQGRPGRRTAYEVQLATTRRELAEKLNLSQETLSRVFHQLVKDGVLAVYGRMIQVLDCERLAEVTQAGPSLTH